MLCIFSYRFEQEIVIIWIVKSNLLLNKIMGLVNFSSRPRERGKKLFFRPERATDILKRRRRKYLLKGPFGDVPERQCSAVPVKCGMWCSIYRCLVLLCRPAFSVGCVYSVHRVGGAASVWCWAWLHPWNSGYLVGVCRWWKVSSGKLHGLSWATTAGSPV